MDFLDPKAEILRITGDGVQPLPVQRELADGSVLLGFMNITYDAWERVELRCAALARHAAALVLEGGEWQPLADYAPKGDTLVLNRTVPPMEALLIWLK
jgi:hypothetical protein